MSEYRDAALSEWVREGNDAMRKQLCGESMFKATQGRLMVTPGIREVAVNFDILVGLLRKVAEFSDFNEGNDPWGEHDYGSFDFNGRRVMWKFDYYDNDKCEYGADTEELFKTKGSFYRVLFVMLPEER